MKKGDKVKLISPSPKFDKWMGISVGDIGTCISDVDTNDDAVCVNFGSDSTWIICERLEVVDENLNFSQDDISRITKIIDIATKEYDGLYTDEIDFFIEFLKKKINEMQEK